MNNPNVKHITAVTKVFGDGQKCIAAEVEYDRPLPPSVSPAGFEVQNRTVTGARVEGNTVFLSLSPEDAPAATFHPGMPWERLPPRIDPARAVVTQVRPIPAPDGGEIAPAGADENDRVKNLVADDFVQGTFEGIAYNLYIPKGLAPGERCPLVQFIHDAGPCGPDPRLTLAQGNGATVWAEPEFQARHKCFVLAPQFDGPPIVDDEGHVDPRLETAKRLLDRICAQYPVDRDRLYTTGQSMGCMSSIVLNCRYPGLFAASLLVAGQWSERDIPNLERARLWIVNSVGDAKSFPGMNQITCELESRGVRVARRVMDARAAPEAWNAAAAELAATGASVIHTPFAIESVAGGWHSRGGEHHVATWALAYNVEAIREWLFSQRKENAQAASGLG